MSSEEFTPAQVIGKLEPYAKSQIYTERTQGAIVNWHEGGSFDPGRCVQVRALLLNYKPKDCSKKERRKGAKS